MAQKEADKEVLQARQEAAAAKEALASNSQDDASDGLRMTEPYRAAQQEYARLLLLRGPAGQVWLRRDHIIRTSTIYAKFKPTHRVLIMGF